MAGEASPPQTVTPSQPTCSEAKPLRIVTFNCKNMETAILAFENLSKNTDIFLVQEHWYFDCQLTKLDQVCQDFSSCGKAVDTGDPMLPVQMPRGYGGVAVLWKKDIDHLATKLPDGSNRIQCVEFACQDPLILISVYMPCKGLRDNVEDFKDCLMQLQEIFNKYSSTHTVIVGGDFNEDLYVQKQSERRQLLETFLKHSQLKTRTTEKTYMNPEGVETSTIDYIFFPEKIDHLVEGPQRLEEESGNVSDHIPLACTLRANLTRVSKQKQSIPTPRRIKWDKLDKAEYKATVANRLVSVNGEAKSTGLLDIEIQKLNEILVSSAKMLSPSVVSGSKKPKLRVWSPEIQQAVREKKKAFWEWKLGDRPKTKENWLVINRKTTTSNLRKLCRIESARQRQSARQEILDAKYEDTRLFHRLINKQRGHSKQVVNELHVGDKVFSTPLEIQQGFKEHFELLATPSDDQSFDKDYNNLVELEIHEIQELCTRYPSEIKQITPDQVKKAILSLNRGKSADIYGVTAEHFIYGGDELLMATVDIINSLYRVGELTDCLKVGVLTPIFKKKGSATEAKNYRGITILPTITKILETVLREVIRPTVEEVQSGLQRGFTQNASPMNCSLLLEEIVRESKDQKQPLYMAFLDVKAAFDVVSHESLLRKLFHIGVDGQEWTLIHSLHKGAESVVKWEGSTTDSFKVLQGVRQGGILSTDLYKLYGNGQLQRMEETGIGCHIGEICCVAPTAADDMVLPAPSLTILQKLQSTIAKWRSTSCSQPKVSSLQPSAKVENARRRSVISISLWMELKCRW